MALWKSIALFVVAIGGIYAVSPLALIWKPSATSYSYSTEASREIVPRTSTRSGLPDFTALVDRVGPAVVNVTTRALPKDPTDVAARHYDLYRGLVGEDGPATDEVVGIGSGFIVRNDGYILTNAHVVDGADEVHVRLTGQGKELRARIVGIDKVTDIALLKIRASRLPVVRTGSSVALRVGDWVAAIGSPFGFENTITAGIVSAKERRLPNGSQMPFLQSDVAINPGSSGGPLVNLDGEVVGINSKIYTRTGGYMGVSFAIPIETAVKVGDELRRRGTVTRGFLGIEAQPLTAVLASAFGLRQMTGALVAGIQPGSPAETSALRLGDIVTAYDGKPVDGPHGLSTAVADTAPGQRSHLQVWRHGQFLSITIRVGVTPEEPPAFTAVGARIGLLHVDERSGPAASGLRCGPAD
jgi:serine protease Do